MYGPPPHSMPPVPYAGAPYPPPAQPESDASPRRRRLAAWGIDAALLAGVAVALGFMTWGRLQDDVVGHLPQRAFDAVSGLLLSGGDVGGAAGKLGDDVWGIFVGHIEQALVLLVLIELAYQFTGTAWKGRTVGKAVLDIRVAAPQRTSSPGPGRAARRALATTATNTGLYAMSWVLLLEGLFFLALLMWVAAVTLFVLNAAPTLVGAKRRSVADMLAGTLVVRARSYQRAAQAVRQGAGTAWAGAQVAGQVAGQAARENAAQLAARPRVQQALESDRARQAQDASKRLGGRIKSAYQERRGTPAAPQAQPPPALLPPQPYPYAADLYADPAPFTAGPLPGAVPPPGGEQYPR